mmetsp:Transcript_29312/g.47614  ORF Transcript_29312/g.47614 Transcript_29312/m.47614 type:complete len:219 (-) Transcript_29312:13-669(-)
MVIMSWRISLALAYIVSCVLGALALQSHLFMLKATSFVHYGLYMFTYYSRWPKGDRQKYEDFKRIAFTFKLIALIQLGILGSSIVFNTPPYTIPSSISISEDISSVGLVAAVLIAAYGYYVSAMATKVLGVEGTYFGIELGFVKAEYGFVKKWPYSVYPHPMILGQVVAMVVLHVALFQRRYPWLLPLHCVFYLTHMLQEIYDIWKGEPWYKSENKKN